MENNASARFDYRRDDAHRRIYITGREALLSDDLMAIINRQVREGTWSYSVLHDMRATGTGPTKVETRAIAEHVRAHVARYGPRGPVALVTATDAMETVGQRYAFFLGANFHFQFEVFQDRAEAERWLDERQPAHT
jgi:hypothetical protein